MTKKMITSTMTAILLIALTATMTALPSVYGQVNVGNYVTLPTQMPTYLQLLVNPNPVGVNQYAWIQPIFSKPVPTSHGLLGDMYEGVTIEIIAPDGTKTVKGPYDGGMMGAISTNFMPTQVGTYKIQA